MTIQNQTSVIFLSVVANQKRENALEVVVYLIDLHQNWYAPLHYNGEMDMCDH